MTQFSLEGIIRAIPETIAYLREQRTRPTPVPKPGDESRSTSKPNSKPPCNIDAIDAADLQLECLAYWADEAGISTRNVGHAWRRPTGEIRGVLYDDSRPADVIAARLLAAMADRSWSEPFGMHDHLHELMATQSKRWPTITDTLWRAANGGTASNRGGDRGDEVCVAVAS